MTRNVRRVMARLVPALLVTMLVAACSGSSASGIRVTDAWARTSSAAAAAGAAYMVIENTGSTADALLGVASTIAKSTELHETVVVGTAEPAASAMPSAAGGMMSPPPMGSAMPSAAGSMGSGGMMGMRPVARVEIPAGGKLELKPGSYHIMLIGLAGDLKVGETFEITLKLEKAGDVKTTVQVRAG